MIGMNRYEWTVIFWWWWECRRRPVPLERPWQVHQWSNHGQSRMHRQPLSLDIVTIIVLIIIIIGAKSMNEENQWYLDSDRLKPPLVYPLIEVRGRKLIMTCFATFSKLLSCLRISNLWGNKQSSFLWFQSGFQKGNACCTNVLSYLELLNNCQKLGQPFNKFIRSG